MRQRFFGLFVVLMVISPASAVDGPSKRRVTDPMSVNSLASASAHPVPIADLLYTHTVFAPSIAPDGKQVVFTTDVTGRYNLWKTTLDGSMPVQLLQSEETQDVPVWSPDGDWIVFRQDTGGNEIYDLYAVPAQGGAAVNLTATPDVSETDALFSPDGRFLAITSKPKGSGSADIAVLEWSSHSVRRITHEKTPNHIWTPFGWSADGKYIYANRVKTSYTDSEIDRISVASGELDNLTPHSADLLYNGSSVSLRDDVLFDSNAKAGFQNAGILHANKKIEWITDTEWEASGGNFSPDGHYATYRLNHDGRTDLYLYDTQTRMAEKLNFPEGISVDSGNPTSFSSDGRHLLVRHEDSQRSPELWVFDLRSRKARQLTHSVLASVNPSSIPPSTLVHYSSFDGTIISAYAWIPFNIRRDGSHPVIVLPHGGPTGQTVDKFNNVAAALASRGFICISPNVRGSTGYGISFQKANIKDLGGGDLQDEIYATKFLIATGYANPRKLGITGESYGGYVTLLAISKTPDIWAAAVSEYGIVDWRNLLKNTDKRLGQYVRSLLGDPEIDGKIYDAASPSTYIRSVRAPLLLLQGENDPRVPRDQAQQVYDTLKAMGKIVEVRYYTQEGHGFLKRENRIDALSRMLDWFDRFLK